MSLEGGRFVVNIDDYEHPTALVELDADGKPNEILLVIDWANRSITVETRAQFDYTDDAWLRDRTDIYDLPENVDATELRMWVEREVVPRAQPLAEAFALVTRNGKQWGEFPKMEDERRRFHVWMAIHAEPPTYDWEQWEVADYLPDLPESMSTISDEEIELLADRALRYAAMEGVVFIGGREAVREFLVASRELGEIPLWGERPTTPREPDCYQIRGYAVLEGTVKPYGNSAHVAVPRRHTGKRVKIVVIEP